MKLCLSKVHSSGKGTNCLRLVCAGEVNAVLLLRGAGGRAGLLAQECKGGSLLSHFFCATIKITLGDMQFYAGFIDHAASTQKLFGFGFWLTPDLHQYFWPHKNFFQWQKWLSQPFCFPLLLHPITKAWLLTLLPVTSSAEPVKLFIWPLSEPGQGTDQG